LVITPQRIFQRIQRMLVAAPQQPYAASQDAAIAARTFMILHPIPRLLDRIDLSGNRIHGRPKQLPRFVTARECLFLGFVASSHVACTFSGVATEILSLLIRIAKLFRRLGW